MRGIIKLFVSMLIVSVPLALASGFILGSFYLTLFLALLATFPAMGLLIIGGSYGIDYLADHMSTDLNNKRRARDAERSNS